MVQKGGSLIMTLKQRYRDKIWEKTPIAKARYYNDLIQIRMANA